MNQVNYKASYLTLASATLMLVAGMNSCTVFKGKNAHKKTAPKVGAVATTAKADSAKSPLKPFAQVITAKAVTQKGMITIHKVADKYFFELPDTLMGREIMSVTRLSKFTPGAGNFAGEEVNEQVISFEKGNADNVFLKVITLVNTADSTSQIYKAVTNSNMYPIAAAFPVKAKSKDSSGVVIDVTDFFKGDNTLFGFTSSAKRAFSITSLAADRSYISSMRSYPMNTEIKTVKTYNSTPPADRAPLPAVGAAGVITMELNNSLVLLPKTPMKKRDFDYRVGYFASEYNVFSDQQQEVKVDTYIHRWKLEAKPADMEKWKNGELVEPAKQIVYYIDPATPKKWVPYLIAGINDWQKAFEKAGFKNAIVGKEWPVQDTTMSLEDARYSVLRYLASTQQNAYGPNLADPRSGEILESHIGWYHNVMKLVHNWYMIQAGAIDPRARKMVFDDELMGQLIRFVSSHEIGHTLGLRHNMGASSRTPVEKLRDKKWVEAHGHTASIMDYARFNYVAQPEDNISEAGIFPRIGDYDKWAIQWGYGYLPPSNTEDMDNLQLNKMIVDSLAANPRLWFSGEGKDYDPRSQTEDLGDNSVKASEYGLKNLKRVVAALPEWTKTKKGADYENLAEMYKQAYGQYGRYVGHVLKNLAGVYQTAKTEDQPGAIYAPVPKAVQKEAVAYFNRNIFRTQHWLIDPKILDKINNPALESLFATEQSTDLMLVMSGGRLTRLASLVNRYPSMDLYTPEEVLNDLEKELFSELTSGKRTDFYRRKLQRGYMVNLQGIVDPSSVKGGIPALIASMSAAAVSNSDVQVLAKAHLDKLRKRLKTAIPGVKNAEDKAHFEFMLYTINEMFDAKKK